MLNVLPKARTTNFAIHINKSQKPFKKRNINKNLRWLLYSQVRPSHRNVILPNYILFDKFPGIIQNGKNFIIIVASKKIYGISTILVLKF